MKKIILPLLISCFTCIGASGLPGKTIKNGEPHARFDSIWVDYDVAENGLLGMRLHLKFTAYGIKGLNAALGVNFEFIHERKGSLKDRNGKFRNDSGDVYLQKEMIPATDPAVYNDLQLFMPYDELDLDPGTYQVAMHISLKQKESNLLQKLTRFNFEYIKPGDHPSTVDVGFEDIWIEYDAHENDRRGLKVHFRFRLFNLKDSACYIAVYFSKQDGDKLYGTSSKYKSKTGQAVVYRGLKPFYDDTLFSDLAVFMPYSELNLPNGKVLLQLEADIIDKDSNLLKHLKDYEFWFEQ